ncbi:hypothetical protein [Hyphomicrobium sulfonivorans]|uniref:hypothetical protein n=1 Tax=Hyphomicrobium sulfonivorans TaxID=121290 RepID=UPI00156E1131|nr:hypothetical protein [Hyphomicrobium sulfonivorans]MBI1648326.1 hypothetical protein [Hyphomicrobium sulfonivorans]NSL71139.1 hypothetical protein [Hyphomicrobium sulfonivorans]
MHQRPFDLLINASGILLGAVIVGYVLYDMSYTATVTPCSQRSSATMRFPLHGANGKLLSPMALQARTGGGRNIGVLENASVVPADGGPLPDAMQVELRSTPEASAAGGANANGIEFRWSPFVDGIGTSSCLAYYLRLPKTFDFGRGGVLPGVEAPDDAQTAKQDAVSIQTQWDGQGFPIVRSINENGDTLHLAGTAPLPTDRWLRIELETVLNTAGKNDGILRLWVDGTLAAENTNLSLRTDAATQISNVVVAAGYRQTPPVGAAASLQFSGIEIARLK